MNNAAAATREQARTPDGRFGTQVHPPQESDLVADPLTDHGISPEDAAAWRMRDVSTSDAVAWHGAGFRPFAATEWNRRWFSPAEAREWSDAGADPKSAAEFKAARFTATTAEPWIREGFDAATAREWSNANIRLPGPETEPSTEPVPTDRDLSVLAALARIPPDDTEPTLRAGELLGDGSLVPVDRE